MTQHRNVVGAAICRLSIPNNHTKWITVQSADGRLPSLRYSHIKSFCYIIGSCVTRDAIPISVSHYFARSSIASVMSAPVICPIDFVSASNKLWRARTVYWDLYKEFSRLKWADDTDYLIIDLIDEMYPLLRSNSGATAEQQQLITRSQEFIETGIETSMNLTLITLEEKKRLVLDAIPNFVALLQPLIDKGKVILHEAYWAKTYIDADNNCVENTARMPQIIERNEELKPYYALLKQVAGQNLHTINITDSKLHCADPNHKWGFSPMHFVKGYYDALWAKIQQITSADKEN